MVKKPKVAISACLTGCRVRYDGAGKRDAFLERSLGGMLQYVPVCPEKECGLSVPREPMRLLDAPGAPRLVIAGNGKDITPRMVSWAEKKLAELEKQGLAGYIFKSGSPSCGLDRVKVYDAEGNFSPCGTGIWARMFMERFPCLPVEDEIRLRDPLTGRDFLRRLLPGG